MSNFIVFLGPQYIEDGGRELDSLFLPFEEERILFLSEVRIVLSSSLYTKNISQFCGSNSRMYEVLIEEENIGGKEMNAIVEPFAKSATFEDLIKAVSDEGIKLLKVIGTVIKDTLDKYLDLTQDGIVVLIIAPVILAVAYGLVTLPDYWDILDSNLKNGGIIFEKTKEEVILLQHLR